MPSLKLITMLMLVFVSVSIVQAHAATFQNYELSIFGQIWQALANFFGGLFGSSNTTTFSTTISTTIGTTHTTTVNPTSTTYNSTSTSTLPTSTSSQTTTIYTYSYLSHPICSPTNNTTYAYPDNITCPSSCPYASTMYYEGVYFPNGTPIIQTVPIGQHVCLYSPVTTTTTSTITTSSTTTIPQIEYYHINIIQNPNLIREPGAYITCDGYAFGTNLSFVVNNYYPPTMIANPMPDDGFNNGSITKISAPLQCYYNNTIYSFDGWIGKGNGSITTNVPNTSIVIIGNVTEIAKYISSTTTIIPSTTTISNSKPTYYTLKVMTDGDGGIVSQSGNGTYINGSEVRISAIPSKGYVFGSWMCIIGNVTSLQGQIGVGCKNIGYSGSSLNATIIINSNITEIASFGPTPKQYQSLTINSNPSNIAAQADVTYFAQNSLWSWLLYQLPNTTKYQYGADVNINSLNPGGWAFTGWSCMGTGCYSGNLNPVNITLNNNITETENFAPIYYYLSLKKFTGVEGYSCGNVSQSGNGTYRAGSIVTLYATPTQVYPAYGCDFGGWGGVGGSPIINITMNSNMTEIAYWGYNFNHPPNAVCSNNTVLHVYSASSNVYCPSSCSFLINTIQFSVSPYSGTFCSGDNVSTQWADYTGELGTWSGNHGCIIEPYGQVPAGGQTGIAHWIYYYGIWYDCW